MLQGLGARPEGTEGTEASFPAAALAFKVRNCCFIHVPRNLGICSCCFRGADARKHPPPPHEPNSVPSCHELHEGARICFSTSSDSLTELPSVPFMPEAASTTKQVPYHSCSQTEVNSPAFSTAEAQAWGQEAKRIHYHS